jgi:D-lactate dehydrogenase
MKIAFYSSRDYEIPYLKAANETGFEISFLTESLSLATVEMAEGFDAVSIFTNDDASLPVIKSLEYFGIQYIAVRAAGFDNVDLTAAAAANIRVANVPEYSPNAIAEHAVGMMLALDRKLIAANQQVSRSDFTITNLIGFNLNKKTAGIVGTGRIGSIVAEILNGFGCRLLGFDLLQNRQLTDKYKLQYVDLSYLCRNSDIITIHLPLSPQTKYLVNEKLIREMKPGVMLINTSRGGLVETTAILNALESGKIAFYGMDVYEKEKGVFFNDLSKAGLKDPLLKKLIHHPNVLVTPHIGFATKEALTNIALTTFHNITCWSLNKESENELTSIRIPVTI